MKSSCHNVSLTRAVSISQLLFAFLFSRFGGNVLPYQREQSEAASCISPSSHSCAQGYTPDRDAAEKKRDTAWDEVLTSRQPGMGGAFRMASWTEPEAPHSGLAYAVMPV